MSAGLTCGRGLAPDGGDSVTDTLNDTPQSGASPLPHRACDVFNTELHPAVECRTTQQKDPRCYDRRALSLNVLFNILGVLNDTPSPTRIDSFVTTKTTTNRERPHVHH